MNSRAMQIEFERRITLMNPNFELAEKLTSDTIFSFLNAYTERYVRLNYLQEDAVQDGTRAQKKNADALKGLITRGLYAVEAKDENNTDKTSDRVSLPSDYFLYIRSNSLISKNYKIEEEILNEQDYVVTSNKTIREDDVEKVISTYYNKAIVLNPYVVLNAGNNADEEKKLYLNVIHDEYTTIKKVDLVYYRKPKKFDVIGVDGVNVLDHCELPENVHMEIVEGAVEMFITEAKYRLNMKPEDNK
ncbi:hypothetical protein [uncultured phage cr114_1]|uniref:Uncharacterized protein n=2 Tax=Suoliviridae TaxID=2942966 RepID=A0A7M1RSP8_9CAUD|nr:hypothetical protein KNV51_gp44 [uncultured phage cr4_1]YP_010112952.1 hypothetical protein KNV55_gp046 [uncultured phage cr114_1]QOR57174.1 hypothetical protein [uncultured phage cr4_1]QOR59979.1 hypothetical protein [uncultured phage cr114_1]